MTLYFSKNFHKVPKFGKGGGSRFLTLFPSSQSSQPPQGRSVEGWHFSQVLPCWSFEGFPKSTRSMGKRRTLVLKYRIYYMLILEKTQSMHSCKITVNLCTVYVLYLRHYTSLCRRELLTELQTYSVLHIPGFLNLNITCRIKVGKVFHTIKQF